MRKGGRRITTDASGDQIIAEMTVAIAANLRIESSRIRYIKPTTPGQFGETDPRWEIHYRGEWRELPWHFDGPLCVTRALVRKWYG